MIISTRFQIKSAAGKIFLKITLINNILVKMIASSCYCHINYGEFKSENFILFYFIHWNHFKVTDKVFDKNLKPYNNS